MAWTVLDEYLDANQVGAILRVHPETVKRLIRAGKIPATKFGNRWLVRRDVAEQIASQNSARASTTTVRTLFNEQRTT